MSKLALQNFVNHKIDNDRGREWSFCTEIKTPVLPFRLTGQLWHTGWDIPTCYAIDVDGDCWMDSAHGPSLRQVNVSYLISNAENIVDRNNIRKAAKLPLEKSEAEQLQECKQAIKRMLDSSTPHLAQHNAFLISPESWNELACIVIPSMTKLNTALDKMKRGEKLTEEEIEEALA